MAIYVDNVRIKWAGKKWCHLVADSLDELHDFAFNLGIKRKYFQAHASYPHYDITDSHRKRALELGALAGDRKQIITCAKKMKNELGIAIPASSPKQLDLL